MNNPTRPIDEQVRRLPLVSDEQVRDLMDRAFRQTLFGDITSQPGPATAPPGRTRAWSGAPRRLVALTAMLAALGLATIGWAVMRGGDVSTSTTVGCHLPDGGVAIVNGVTGDPVEDCSRLWEREAGAPAPELAAYDNGMGGIEVVAASEMVPDGWVALQQGPAQHPGLIELEAALADVGAGLGAACLQLDSARSVVLRELDRLGYEDWTIAAERGDANGTETCMLAIVKPTQQRVDLVPLEGFVRADGDPLRTFAGAVHDLVAQDCLTAKDAAARIEQLARDAGVAPRGLQVHSVTDPDATCARAHVTDGGRVDVTVRGPTPTE